MTTPRDLLIVTMDMPSTRNVERGDLSLALAGAELTDLLSAGALELDGDLIVPGYRPTIGDRLLDEAASSLRRRAPYETIGDWLWRRGRGLPEAYLAALEAEEQLTHHRSRRLLVVRTDEMVLVDSPDRHRAADRWAADEPVLAALATAVGIRDRRTADSPDVTGEAVVTVLGAVDDALGELAAERHRRSRRRDDAAVDNVRRGY